MGITRDVSYGGLYIYIYIYITHSCGKSSGGGGGGQMPPHHHHQGVSPKDLPPPPLGNEQIITQVVNFVNLGRQARVTGQPGEGDLSAFPTKFSDFAQAPQVGLPRASSVATSYQGMGEYVYIYIYSIFLWEVLWWWWGGANAPPPPPEDFP